MAVAEAQGIGLAADIHFHVGGTQHERYRIGLQLAAHGAEGTFAVLVKTIHHRYGVNLFFYIDPILSSETFFYYTTFFRICLDLIAEFGVGEMIFS